MAAVLTVKPLAVTGLYIDFIISDLRELLNAYVISYMI
jgi:hypothetical protein